MRNRNSKSAVKPTCKINISKKVIPSGKKDSKIIFADLFVAFYRRL